MKIRNLVLPASMALALVVGACANATSTPEGNSVGLDKDAKPAACCPEMDKAHCAEAKAAGKCEGTKMSCDKAKADGEAVPGTPKTDS
jgi:hypothetical protein